MQTKRYTQADQEIHTSGLKGAHKQTKRYTQADQKVHGSGPKKVHTSRPKEHTGRQKAKVHTNIRTSKRIL